MFEMGKDKEISKFPQRFGGKTYPKAICKSGTIGG